MKAKNKGLGMGVAAAKAGMDEKTARKYLRAGGWPESLETEHTWRTRLDPFEEVWPEMAELLALNGGLQAKTLFAELGRRYPGRFEDGQLRTLQRRVRQWKALEGPDKEVFFSQIHSPGDLCASDFCHLTELGVTINYQRFEHLIFHMVLTYSNWETGCICYSESFESLSDGLQQAFFTLGGVPKRHRTDSLSAAVQHLEREDTESDQSRRTRFTQRYSALLDHFAIKGEHTAPGQGNENGDVEQSHNRFKQALDQALMLRGSRNFDSCTQYSAFIGDLFKQLNTGRQAKFEEEQKLLSPLPSTALDTRKRRTVRVSTGSLITLDTNSYSVPASLIGLEVEARMGSTDVEVWLGQKLVLRMERLRGRKRHQVNYRHIIDWLVRKPGAFANYTYQSDLFPSSHFRLAYDVLQERHTPQKATKSYLAILQLAAMEGQSKVEASLQVLHQRGEDPSVESVNRLLLAEQLPLPIMATGVHAPVLGLYDGLLWHAGNLTSLCEEMGHSHVEVAA